MVGGGGGLFFSSFFFLLVTAIGNYVKAGTGFRKFKSKL